MSKASHNNKALTDTIYGTANNCIISQTLQDMMKPCNNHEEVIITEQKLTEKFVESYKIKKIILENTVELELLMLMKNSPSS